VTSLLLLVGLAAAPPTDAAPVTPLSQAHAHNDYRHARPLVDALAHGFTSVEADIFLVAGKLLVGHDREELRPERTLEALYLDPLRERVRQNGGRVYPAGPVFTLLIDIKSDGEATYAALREMLAKYDEILSAVREGKVDERAVTVVVSGNRARETIAAEKVRRAAIDGRLSDLDSALPAHLLPLISDNWRNHFTWRGDGPMAEAERRKLRGMVRKAHDKGRRVRFWATPENRAVWRELVDAGVDLINTDDLAGLEDFLRQGGSPGKQE